MCWLSAMLHSAKSWFCAMQHSAKLWLRAMQHSAESCLSIKVFYCCGALAEARALRDPALASFLICSQTQTNMTMHPWTLHLWASTYKQCCGSETIFSDPDPDLNFLQISDPDPTFLKVLDPDPTFSEFWIWIRLFLSFGSGSDWNVLKTVFIAF
jgi:hypothetical protein